MAEWHGSTAAKPGWRLPLNSHGRSQIGRLQPQRGGCQPTTPLRLKQLPSAIWLWLAQRPALCVVALGLLHRAILFWRYRPALLALVAQVPWFQAMQLLPMPIYREHFWSGLWLLQQTPPMAHVVFRLVLLAGGWPFRTAELLCVLQGVVSALSAGLLCALIVKLTQNRPAGLLLSLWFLFSTDLVVTEYAFYGQVFYEVLGMSGVLACCWQACRVREGEARQAAGRAAGLGGLAGLTALTRSSLSFFPIALGVAGLLSWRRRTLAAFVVPVLLLQGGWAVKNWVALGRLSPETSSWSGMNLAKGVFWAHQGALLCRDIVQSPDGSYPDWFRESGRHCRFAFQVATQETLPPALRAEDDAMTARLGGIRPTWNLPSVAAESDAWRQAVARFTWAHPGLFMARFGLGYRLLWQRIADHAIQFPWNLFTVQPVDRPWPGLFTRGFAESDQVAIKALGLTAQPGRKAWLGTVSLAPLDSLSILALHVFLPLLLLLDLWRRWHGTTTFLPRGTLVLLAAVGYGLLLFSVAEGGENMRFRTAIEPEIIALTACTFAGLWRAARTCYPSIRPGRLPEATAS